MKQKTKKRLRAVALPFIWAWAVLAMTIAFAGISLESLAYVMLGDVRMAKQTIKDQLS